MAPCIGLLLGALLAKSEPNPPTWPATVHVFGPDSGNIADTVQDLYARQDLYDTRRAALLFKPGVYDTDIPVGYYTSVHGLGSSPQDVTFAGHDGIHEAEAGNNLIKFWRSAENLVSRPASGRMVWSVSQAAPLRRMVVDGDLVFGTEADTQGSGGYVGNLKVTGQVNFTMQQQWIMRNCEIEGGMSYFQDPPRSVNFVFVGTPGSPVPTTECTNSASNPVSPSPQKLVIDNTPISVEKPYITIDAQGKYNLVTPKASYDTSGTQWEMSNNYVDGFEKVFIASNSTDVATINAKLAEGLHVILAPGIYSLSEPIRIGRTTSSYQVLMGLGLATLVPLNGDAAIEVGDVPGIRICGLLLQAGPSKSHALISVGTQPTAGDALNPILLADVFARVGGPDSDPVESHAMMEINASHVVLDNVWLWRADVQNTHRSRDCQHGLVVNGHNVTAYGLASEHEQSDNVVWNGEDGRVYFYQAELDGLATNEDDKTPDYGPNGVSGYRVNAKRHLAVGVGVYCWFSNPGVIVQSGVKVLHKETVGGITCPFQWVWENANTPPKGNSTINEAILVAEDQLVI
eukprot:TRINITY_DN68806_c0_g1_i1.p1 TRINITY_DN68806_c0_g1~~TRINITY_DN68806_c0_g1_i1.p1  ORF type:complete len:590 (+),score=78.93 TRINITY_DN68806_c0_g1_i1:53-1771(+)